MGMFMSSKVELCPLCSKLTVAAHKPFCSRGCKDRDLLNWLGEAYAIPDKPHEEEDSLGLDSTPEA
jgi:uncharacterized protein